MEWAPTAGVPAELSAGALRAEGPLGRLLRGQRRRQGCGTMDGGSVGNGVGSRDGGSWMCVGSTV